MATVAVYNMQGAEVGKMDLNDAIFGVEVNEHLVKMVVTAHLAAERQGTQKAKTRSEVSGVTRVAGVSLKDLRASSGAVPGSALQPVQTTSPLLKTSC